MSRQSSISSIAQPNLVACANDEDEARTRDALRDAEMALQQLEHTQQLEGSV